MVMTRMNTSALQVSSVMVNFLTLISGELVFRAGIADMLLLSIMLFRGVRASVLRQLAKFTFLKFFFFLHKVINSGRGRGIDPLTLRGN